MTKENDMDWIRRTFAPNRLAVYLTVASGLAAAIVPAIQGLDTTSTTTVVAGLVAIGVAAWKYLEGWQKHEDREAVALQTAELATPAPTTPTDVPAAVVTAAVAKKKAPAKSKAS